MNRREFYKQLMSEYTFDSDKVRRAAKRSSMRALPSGGAKFLPVAAAVVLSAGVIALYSGLNRPSSPIAPPARVYTASAGRLTDARNGIEQYRDSIEVKATYLSFAEPLDYAKLQNTIDYVSDTGKIRIEALYILDGSDEVVCVTDPTQISEIRDGANAQIVGAKVSAPANLCETLAGQPEVLLVEIGLPNVTDETFVPLIVEDPDIVFTEPPVIPESTDTSDNSAWTDGSETQEPAAAVSENTESGETAAAEETSGITADTPENSEISETSPESEQVSQSSDPASEPAQTVPHDSLIELYLPGVTDAEFIGENKFIAFTKNSVGLYSIEPTDADCEIAAVTSFEIGNFRKRYSASGNSFIISGCSGDNRRTLLFLADGDKNTLEQIDISALLAEDGELVFAFYDDSSNRIIARISRPGSNSLYLINRANNETTELLCVTDDIAVLAVNGNSLYYSSTKPGQSAAVCKINVSDGTVADLFSFDGSVNFDRSDSLKNFSVNTDGDKVSYVFDSDTEKLTSPVETAHALIFRDWSSSELFDGEKYYTLIGGELLETAESDLLPAKSRRGSSEYAVHEMTEETLKIKVK